MIEVAEAKGWVCPTQCPALAQGKISVSFGVSLLHSTVLHAVVLLLL